MNLLFSPFHLLLFMAWAHIITNLLLITIAIFISRVHTHASTVFYTHTFVIAVT